MLAEPHSTPPPTVQPSRFSEANGRTTDRYLGIFSFNAPLQLPELAGWLGLQEIIFTVLMWPGALVDFLLGAIFLFVALWVIEKHEAAERLAQFHAQMRNS